MATLEEFVRRNKPEGFKALPHYVPESDTVVFLFKPEDSYAQRVDHLLTVYRSMETDELVGCEIKGVKHNVELLGNFRVLIEDTAGAKRIKLGWLFLAAMTKAEEGARETYLQLGILAGHTELEDLALAA